MGRDIALISQLIPHPLSLPTKLFTIPPLSLNDFFFQIQLLRNTIMRRTIATTWVSILTYTALLSGSGMNVTAAPQVRIGNTVVTGLAEAGAGTEFFGGMPQFLNSMFVVPI
jgi:hypothetical protein